MTGEELKDYMGERFDQLAEQLRVNTDALERHRMDDRASFKELWIELHAVRRRIAFYGGCIAFAGFIATFLLGVAQWARP